MIILGRYGDKFAEGLYELMKEYRENISYCPFSYRIFPDDECLVRFCDEPYLAITKGEIRFPPQSEKVRDAIKKDPNVIFINRGASGYKWKPIHEFVNALFSSMYLKKEMGTEKVSLIIPNMPFAKQDKIFYDKNGRKVDGAPVTVKMARNFLRQYADLLVSFNPHDFRDKTGWIVKNENTIPDTKKGERGCILDENNRVIIPEPEDWTGFAYAIDATPVLIEYIMEQIKNPFLIGADQSVKSVIKNILERYKNVSSADVKKQRDKYQDCLTTSEIGEMPKDLSNQDVLIIDDVIVTASSMENILDNIEKYNPRRKVCAAVHGEFSYNIKRGKSAYDLLKEKGAEIIVTDTIETPVSEVSVVPLLTEELYKII